MSRLDTGLFNVKTDHAGFLVHEGRVKNLQSVLGTE